MDLMMKLLLRLLRIGGLFAQRAWYHWK